MNVGFCPTVYRVAKLLGLRGYVLNKGSNVEIGIGKNGTVERFLNSLMIAGGENGGDCSGCLASNCSISCGTKQNRKF